jgi:hypothetical protein
MCLFPAAFPAIALVFAAACLVTTLTRLRQGWVAFGGMPTPAVPEPASRPPLREDA